MIQATIPGSKSVSNRVLILASLGDKPLIIKNLLICDDINFLIQALKNFGIKFEFLSKNELKVSPCKILKGNKSKNFIGNGGTPARFLTALSVLVEGEFELFGVDRMHQRPFSDIFEAIEKLGVEIDFKNNKNFLPASFKSKISRLNQKTSSTENQKKTPEINISGKTSSQFISALLLISSKLPNGLKIKIKDNIPSLPYIKMTQEVLEIFGIKVQCDQNFKYFEIPPQKKPKTPDTFTIPVDCSSASYPLAFACLKKKSLKIKNFGTKTFQGDEKFLEVLAKMGVKIKRTQSTLEILPPSVLQPLGEIDFAKMPDVSMTAMLLASFAEGASVFRGLESLRIKECDRILAMTQGLSKLGINIQSEGDQVKIQGDSNNREKILKTTSQNLTLNSYEDHRIALIWGILRSALTLNFKISEPECVSKSWPDFWLELADWNQNLRPVSAAIIQNPKDKKFLIVEKPRKDNKWQFPQGGVDSGESPLMAAKREIAEECGAELDIKFRGEKPLGEYQYWFPKAFKRHDKNIIGAKVSFFYALYISGKVIVDNQEIINYKWVSQEDLKNYFQTSYLTAIENILKKSNNG